jgi:membrane protein
VEEKEFRLSLKGGNEKLFGPLGRFLEQLLRVCRVALTGFMEDQCLLRASALTYTSLLSLVPFLTIGFAVLKGLGFQRRLEMLLLEKFTPASREVIDRIMEYVDRTNASSLGVLGTIGLLLTAVMTMRTMENSLNAIWKVGRSRPWLRTLADYASILVLAPLSGLLALSLTAYFNSPGFVQRMESVWILAGAYRLAIKLSPFLILWIAFGVCYALVPNTKVKMGSAMTGAAFTAVMWQLAQWAYIRYQFGVARYDAIYGALSQLPVFLVWIYVSWLIVLWGAEVAHAHEQRNTATVGKKRKIYLEGMLGVLELLARRFQAGQRPLSLRELAHSLPLERGEVMRCLEALEEMGWIAPCSQDSDWVVFQKSPEQMRLEEIGDWARRQMGEEGWGFARRKIEAALTTVLRGFTVADLAKDERGPGGDQQRLWARD